jgi:hypothetical protein
MKNILRAALVALVASALGCGALYQAGTRVRGHRMLNSLQAGQTAAEIRNQWGQPDIISDAPNGAQVWSYAERPNSDDIAASLLYTSAKEGDKGTFIDLQLVDGKLQSWSEAEHRMPAKKGTHFGYSIGAGPATAHF